MTARFKAMIERSKSRQQEQLHADLRPLVTFFRRLSLEPRKIEIGLFQSVRCWRCSSFSFTRSTRLSSLGTLLRIILNRGSLRIGSRSESSAMKIAELSNRYRWLAKPDEGILLVIQQRVTTGDVVHCGAPCDVRDRRRA